VSELDALYVICTKWNPALCVPAEALDVWIHEHDVVNHAAVLECYVPSLVPHAAIPAAFEHGELNQAYDLRKQCSLNYQQYPSESERDGYVQSELRSMIDTGLGK
jgi:hypothetical protein